jgi:hypothetical protein
MDIGDEARIDLIVEKRQVTRRYESAILSEIRQAENDKELRVLVNRYRWAKAAVDTWYRRLANRNAGNTQICNHAYSYAVILLEKVQKELLEKGRDKLSLLFPDDPDALSIFEYCSEEAAEVICMMLI